MASYIPELTNISFSAISTHLKLFSESLGLPNTSANSPLLGVSPELYYFVIGASRLGLAVPPNDSDFAPASSLKAKILEWKDIYGLETYRYLEKCRVVCGCYLFIAYEDDHE
jgi:hypothetical protein